MSLTRPSSLSIARAALAGALFLGASGARADYIDHYADPDDIGLMKIPRSGSPTLLVVPVVVDDQPFEGGSEAAWLDEIAAFYDPDATGFSLAAYYATASLGRYTPRPLIADPVRFPTCPALGGYPDCEIPRGGGFADGNIAAAAQTLRDALHFIDEILSCANDGPGGDRTCTAGGGVDFTAIDTYGVDGASPDTYADGVILVSNAGFPGIALPVKDLATQPLLSFLGPFPAFNYDGVTVGATAIAGRESAPRRASYVSVHELGHLLGWVDLYTENGLGTDMPYSVMGGWFYSEAASLPDAFSRAAAGWAHVIQASGKQTITIGAAAIAGTTVKVGTGDEFFMVELREKGDDVDADFEVTRGVVIERVRLQKRPAAAPGSYPASMQNYVNDNPNDSFLAIEQADQIFDLDRGRARKDGDDLFQEGDSIGPSSNTEPRSSQNRVFSTNRYDGTPTDITITVTAVGDGSATIEVDAPDVADACAEIAALCGAEPCADGACGAVASAQIIPPAEECSCAVTSRTGREAWSAALCLLLLVPLRRPRRG